METYQIKRIKQIRRRTDYIILIPATNFIQKKFPITPMVRDSGYQYTWGIWEKYFLYDLKLNALPCHYFIEEIENDFACIVGLAEYHPSYFIQDMVSSGIFDYKYTHSIVVMMEYAFDRFVPEKRFYQQMTNKVLDQLLRRYDLQPNRIKLIDECLNDDWEYYLKASKLDYELNTTKYFDMNHLNSFLFKYKNY